VLTDLAGPYYAVVVETTLSSLAEYEETRSSAMSNQDWREAYQKFSPHVESGYCEIFTTLE
jgi:NIPSNAP protein